MTTDYTDRLKQLDDDLKARESWQNVFKPKSAGLAEDARYVLAAIARECGVGETDPEMIKPDRMSLWHWIQYQLGITRDDIQAQMKALLSTASNEDIVKMKRVTQAQILEEQERVGE